VQNKNADNSLRNQAATTASTTGLSTTTESDLDGDGTFDRELTDAVTLNDNGSRTETVTEKNGNGSLRSQTATWTSADGRSITITRDANGDGALDETESITTAAGGAVTDQLVHLNPNGSVRDRTTTTTSADGNTVTTEVDLDGDGDADTTTWHSLEFLADGSTEFLYNYAGTTLVNTTIISVSADGRSVTTWKDFDGDGTADLLTTDVTVINANGSQVRTLENFSSDDSLRDSTITTTSADGRTITISADTYGDWDATSETLHKTIVVQADGKEVATVTYPNTTYGEEVDTRTRSANGLSSSVAIIDPNVGWDWINVSSVTTLNSDGSRTEVFNNPDPWGYSTTTTTSATGLSRTVQMSGTANYSDPTLTMNATDVTVPSANGSTTRTVTSAITQTTSNSTGGTSKSVTTTSDDGLSTTVQLDVNNDGRFDRTDATVVAVDGSTTETVTLLNYSTGALARKDVLATSFDGRTQSLQRDTNGDSVFDHFETTVTNTDGSITGTTWNTNASGGMLDRLVTTTSANGLSKSSTLDANGDGTIDFSQTTTTVLNADGSQLTVVSDYFGNGSLRRQTVTRTSANGLEKTTEFDLNGDGVVDELLTDVTTFYADGTRDRLTTETYADGTAKDWTYNYVDGATYNSYELTEFDTNGDDSPERDIETWVDQDGYRTQFLTYYNANGSIKQQIDSENSPDGLWNMIWYNGAPPDAFPNENTYTLAGANGSYVWNKYTSSIIQTATHTIDEGGVDHWVWLDQTISAYNSNPVYKTLRIDLTTEKKLIDMARRIYDTLLDRTMAQSEVQMLAKYISSAGILNTTQLVTDLMATTEFQEQVRHDHLEPAVRGAGVSECAQPRRFRGRAQHPGRAAERRHDHARRDREPYCGEQRAPGARQHPRDHQQHRIGQYDVRSRPHYGQAGRWRHHPPPLRRGPGSRGHIQRGDHPVAEDPGRHQDRSAGGGRYPGPAGVQPEVWNLDQYGLCQPDLPQRAGTDAHLFGVLLLDLGAHRGNGIACRSARRHRPVERASGDLRCVDRRCRQRYDLLARQRRHHRRRSRHRRGRLQPSGHAGCDGQPGDRDRHPGERPHRYPDQHRERQRRRRERFACRQGWRQCSYRWRRHRHLHLQEHLRQRRRHGLRGRGVGARSHSVRHGRLLDSECGTRGVPAGGRRCRHRGRQRLGHPEGHQPVEPDGRPLQNCGIAARASGYRFTTGDEGATGQSVALSSCSQSIWFRTKRTATYAAAAKQRRTGGKWWP